MDNIEIHDDPMYRLKMNLATYINSLIDSAIEEDELLKETKKYLLDKIPSLDFKDLRALYSTLTEKKAIINNQLTNLLKPTQTASSPLLDALSEVKKSEKDVFEKTSNELSGDELRKIDNASRVYQMLEEIAKKMEENGNTEQN